MINSISKFISWVFLPLFVPIYGLLAVLFIPSKSFSFNLLDSLYYYPLEAKYLYLLLFTVFVVLAPGMSLIVLRLNKSISSLGMENREERSTPIAIMTFYCLVLYLFLIAQKNTAMVPDIIKGMALGGTIASAAAYFINQKFKISLHSIGMGALVGFVFMYFTKMESFEINLLLGIFILSGVVMSARMYLKAHNLKEIGFGYTLGVVSQIICIYFYSNLI
ncbi:MAG: phosphatase PAP2 family protein [Brumimicrobium sp.]